MKLYGLVEVGNRFGRNRDQMDAYIRKCGCPDASVKVGRRRAFTEDDVEAIRRWFKLTGKRFPEPVEA